MHPLRLHPLNPLARSGPRPGAGAPVLYWMQNAQRAADNPALDLGAAIAGGSGSGVTALFVLDSEVPYASARTFSFLLDGLAALSTPLRRRRAPFAVRSGSPPEEVARPPPRSGRGWW